MTTPVYLTTLTRARVWAGVTSSNDDALITSLIAEVSRFILNYLGRSSITSNNYTELRDGEGQQALLLRHWPVTEINSISVDGGLISRAGGLTQSGYVLEPWDGIPAGFQQKISLRGYCFSRGVGNVQVSYRAGYEVTEELHVVPSQAPYAVMAHSPYGSWVVDNGITYANGAALAPVGGNPAQGQYTVSNGNYSFAALDAGAQVLLSYSYVPSDVEHACVALVAERYRYRSRIGEISKSLGGAESMSYSQKDLPEFVKTLLQPYRRMVPV